MLPPPFRACGDHIGIALNGGEAVFTTRRGGVSAAPYESLNLGLSSPAGGEEGDDERSVARNRELLAEHVGIPFARFRRGRQVHGTNIAKARDRGSALSEADGQATAARGEPALVLTADCLPIALIAPGAVAAIHAGWRGLAAGVLEAGVDAVRELAGDGPIHAAIGPGAGVCCYEVGPEVRAAFAEHPGALAPGGRVDLKLIARERLERAGTVAVHDCRLCTICSDPSLFFSHRRDGGVTGRQGGVVWRS